MTNHTAQQQTDKIVTLDIEASGLSSDSYPIEVGVILANGNSWCSLVKPEKNWQHWSEQAQSVHHIARKRLFTHGKSIYNIAETLNKLLAGKTVYSDFWVLDDRWLKKLYYTAQMTPTFVLRDIMYLLKEEHFNYWETTKKRIAKELNMPRHRATNDARILQEAFYHVSQLPRHSRRLS